MLRRLLVLALAAAAAVPAVSAADGVILSAQPNANLAAPGGRLVLSARLHGAQTLVRALAPGGRVLGRSILAGRFGVPLVTQRQRGGFAPDGRSVVLASIPRAYPPRVSHLLVLDPELRSAPRRLTFRGDYGFDALSPGGRLLYLIQRLSTRSAWTYRVRVYDLAAGRLRPRPIADRVEHEWTMQGSPLARVAAAGGARVYTLYQTPTGGVFVHALDTVHASARCIDLPWHDNRSGYAWRLRLGLGQAGLEVRDSGRVVATIDTGANVLRRADRVP